MNDEIEMMKYIVKCINRRVTNGLDYLNKPLIRLYQYLFKQYYTIKRYWEEIRE